MPTPLTSDPKGYQFKMSDILNIGSIFGGDTTTKGASMSSAVNSGVDALGAAGMDYAMANKSGATDYQKRSNKTGAGISAALTGLSLIPGFGTAAMALQGIDFVTGKLAKKANKIGLSGDVGASSGFTGLASKIGDQNIDTNTYNKAGGFTKLAMGGRKKLDELTAKYKGFQRTASGIVQNTQRQMAGLGGASQNIGMQNQINFQGLPEVPVGKKGLKINTEFLKEFKKFKEGGKIDNPQNVIVEGKLHKELNHMEDVTESDITRKGVPVLEMEEGGQLGDQTAELERDEIIFHLQLTKKLEELEKENTDESMIEAGKILSKEILKNTKDSKSKLLKTIQ